MARSLEAKRIRDGFPRWTSCKAKKEALFESDHYLAPAARSGHSRKVVIPAMNLESAKVAENASDVSRTGSNRQADPKQRSSQ